MNRRERTLSPAPYRLRKLWRCDHPTTTTNNNSINSIDDGDEKEIYSLRLSVEDDQRNVTTAAASTSAFSSKEQCVVYTKERRQLHLQSLFDMLPSNGNNAHDDNDGGKDDNDDSIFSESDDSQPHHEEKNNKNEAAVPTPPASSRAIRLEQDERPRTQAGHFSATSHLHVRRKLEEAALSEAMSGHGRSGRQRQAVAVVRNRSGGNNHHRHGHYHRGMSQPPPSSGSVSSLSVSSSSRRVEVSPQGLTRNISNDATSEAAPNVQVIQHHDHDRHARSSSLPRLLLAPEFSSFPSENTQCHENGIGAVVVVGSSSFSAFSSAVPSPSTTIDKVSLPLPSSPLKPTFQQTFPTPSGIILLPSSSSTSQQPSPFSSPPTSPDRKLNPPTSALPESPAYSTTTNTTNTTDTSNSTNTPNNSTNATSSREGLSQPHLRTLSKQQNSPKKTKLSINSPGRSVETCVTSACNSITSSDESSPDDNDDHDEHEDEHCSDKNADITTTTTTTAARNATAIEQARLQSGGASTPRTALLARFGISAHHHRFARHRQESATSTFANNDGAAQVNDNHDDVLRSQLDEMKAELLELREWKKQAQVTNQEHTTEVDMLTSQMLVLKSQCEEHENSLLHKKNEIATLEQQLKEGSLANAVMEKEKEAKTQEIWDLKSRLSSLNAAKYEITAENQELKFWREGRETEMKMKDIEMMQLRESNHKLRGANESLSSDVEMWKAKAEELGDVCQRLQSAEAALELNSTENTSLLAKVEGLEAELERSKSSCWTHKAKIDALQEQVHSELVQKNALSDQVGKLQELKRSSDESIKESANANQTLESLVKTLRIDYGESEARVKELLGDNEKIRGHVEELKKKLSQSETAVHTKDEEINLLKNEVSRLSMEALALTSVIVELREKATAFKLEEDLTFEDETERDSTLNTEVSRLENELAEKYVMITQLSEALGSKEKDNSSLQIKLEVLAYKEETASQEIRELQEWKKASEKNTMDLQAQAEKKEEELRLVLQDVEQLLHDHESVKDANRKQLTEERMTKQKLSDEFEKAIDTKEMEITQLKTEVKNALLEINEMRSKTMPMSPMTEPLPLQIAEFKEQKSNAEKTIGEQAKDIEQMKMEISNLFNQCQGQEKSITEKEAEIMRLEQKIHAECHAHCEATLRFEDELSTMIKSVDSMNQEIQTKSDQIRDLTKEISTLENENEKLRTDIAWSEISLEKMNIQLSSINEEKLAMAQSALDMATAFEEKIYVLQLSTERAHVLEGDLERQQTKYQDARKALASLEKALLVSI